MNLLNYIGERLDFRAEVRVYTMQGENNLSEFYSPASSIKIIRKGHLYNNQKPLNRYLSYFQFYLSVIMDCIYWKPSVVLYFETLSSLPAVVYKKYINRKAELMIHYHEYSSLDEYKNGMKLSRWFHRLEESIYTKAYWISHTNKNRLERFLADHSGRPIPNTYVLPNYPPLKWMINEKDKSNREVIRIIYIGAFSLDTMYIKEFSDWIIKCGGKVIWHIYSANITSEAIAYIDSLKTKMIEFKGAIDYQKLPEVLKQYNAGVILYKGHIPNYIFNAPNKLFEYFACGLDVWFPLVMKGSIPYITRDTYPKIIGLDFNALDQENITVLLNRSESVYKPSEYYCEYVLVELVDKILHL